MSATNSTPNYGLPQYVAEDKPTYLGDFNKAMLDIDTNMKSIDNKAEGAESGIASVQATANQALENANQASTKADTAQATATQAQTSATQAQSSATQAQSTATQAQSTATQAQSTANSVNTKIDNLLTEINDWINESINIGSLSGQLNFGINKKLNLINFYGSIGNLPSSATEIVIGTLPSEYRPNTERTIRIGAWVAFNDYSNILPYSLVIQTDGTIKVTGLSSSRNHNNIYIQFMLNCSEWFN